jgi:hypothetical protein
MLAAFGEFNAAINQYGQDLEVGFELNDAVDWMAVEVRDTLRHPKGSEVRGKGCGRW